MKCVCGRPILHIPDYLHGVVEMRCQECSRSPTHENDGKWRCHDGHHMADPSEFDKHHNTGLYKRSCRVCLAKKYPPKVAEPTDEERANEVGLCQK